MFTAAVIGLAAGAHTSTWGMYKDSIHEGFTYPKYLRSTVLGALVALILWVVFRPELTSAGAAVVFFGAVYAGERLLIEYWKTFLREEDQSKYFIPMRFAVRGRVVASRAARLGVGAVAALLLVLLFAVVIRYQPVLMQLPSWLVLVIVGSLGGWISAMGGAWKDAPHEGFETFKFFRSPAICLGWATVLAFLTTDVLQLGMASLGLCIATIETYKTFFFPNKPRGKFAGKPIRYPEMLSRRQRFVPLYIAIWLGVLLLLVLGFLEPRRGLIG